MGENSQIEWTTHTFNPWTGCTKVSPACDHCYAESWAARSGHVEWGPHGERRRTKTWGNPVKWEKKARADGVTGLDRPRVFCASLADVFDNHKSIKDEWRDELWLLIAATPHLDWLLVTKRPQNMARYLPPSWSVNGCPDNVWLGTTVESQEEANRRIPDLLRIQAKVHFLSCEPMLERIDLRMIQKRGSHRVINVLTGNSFCETSLEPLPKAKGIDWVIAGGESGSKARPMHPDWARDLRDQCAAAGVPFLFKQWGEWIPASEVQPTHPWHKASVGEISDKIHAFDAKTIMFRVGKMAAGRRLDGVLHDGYPEVKCAS